jgi:hypothetical protein
MRSTIAAATSIQAVSPVLRTGSTFLGAAGAAAGAAVGAATGAAAGADAAGAAAGAFASSAITAIGARRVTMARSNVASESFAFPLVTPKNEKPAVTTEAAGLAASVALSGVILLRTISSSN